MSRKSWRKSGYQITTHLAVVILLVIMFVSVGYFLVIAQSDLPFEQDGLLAELEANRERWMTQRPAGFRYVVDRTCSCPVEEVKPFVVTEESGERTARFPLPVETSAGVVLTEPSSPIWLEDIFGQIEQAVRDGAVVSVRFDPARGFPMSVSIDFERNDEGADIGFEIRDFEVLDYR